MMEAAGSRCGACIHATVYEDRSDPQEGNTIFVLLYFLRVIYYFRMSKTPEQVLQEWIDAGLSKPGKSNTELGRLLGIPQSRVSEMRKGRRLVKSTELPIIADYLEEALPADLSPSSVPSGTVPLVGHVGAGAEIFSIDDHAKGGGLDEVERPLGASRSTVAVRVRGDSMKPAYKDGDLLYYDQQANGDLNHLIGADCVVRLADGRMFVKELRRSDGNYWLHSHNADPMFNVAIDWAAKVKWVHKA